MKKKKEKKNKKIDDDDDEEINSNLQEPKSIKINNKEEKGKLKNCC